MVDPFGTMVDNLFGSVMAERIDYVSKFGHVVLDIPALVRRPDVEGDLGEVRVSHNVRQFEIRASDLGVLAFEPEKDDFIRPAGQPSAERWKVQRKPHQDRLGVIWIFDTYLEAFAS